MKNNSLYTAFRKADGPEIRRGLTVFFACLLAVSMMLSPFLLSISMWGLVGMAFWEMAVECKAKGLVDKLSGFSAWWIILRASFQKLFRQAATGLLPLLLLVPVLSFFWSEDKVYWLERSQVRLPFLVLPWAFANLPTLPDRQMRLVPYVLVWALTLICLGASINFALDFDAHIAGIGRGDPIPVPRSHIRFSLILATGIVTGGWLLAEGYYWRWRQERVALGVALLFLFVFIHVLSVRSGIVGLYAMLLFALVRYVWQSRRWGFGVLALTALLGIPLAAINTIPSLKMRVQYMLWDWQQYRQNVGNSYSDAERMISLRVGVQLWRENPWLGIGAGDLPGEVQKVVAAQYPAYRDAPKLPHNQFVYILTGTGLVGLCLSLLAFLAPLSLRRHRQFFLFSAFQILIFASFLVEYTIETAIGVAFYLFYTLWFGKMSCKS